MEQQKLESLLIDYIDGKLNSVDKHYVEQELLKNPKSFRLYEELKEVIQLLNKRDAMEPSSALKQGFEAMLAQEMKENKPGKQIFLQPVWYRAAAAVAFLVAGVSLGYWVSNYKQQQAEIARANEERKQVEMMVTMIRNEESAGQRILGVRAATKNDAINEALIQVLIETLNQDPNVNVRMAALEGLRRFYNEPGVRKALINSLSIQTDPVIQIPLIQTLVEMKEKGAIAPLKKIIQDADPIPAVKDEANMGIMVLS